MFNQAENIFQGQSVRGGNFSVGTPTQADAWLRDLRALEAAQGQTGDSVSIGGLQGMMPQQSGGFFKSAATGFLKEGVNFVKNVLSPQGLLTAGAIGVVGAATGLLPLIAGVGVLFAGVGTLTSSLGILTAEGKEAQGEAVGKTAFKGLETVLAAFGLKSSLRARGYETINTTTGKTSTEAANGGVMSSLKHVFGDLMGGNRVAVKNASGQYVANSYGQTFWGATRDKTAASMTKFGTWFGGIGKSGKNAITYQEGRAAHVNQLYRGSSESNVVYRQSMREQFAGIQNKIQTLKNPPKPTGEEAVLANAAVESEAAATTTGAGGGGTRKTVKLTDKQQTEATALQKRIDASKAARKTNEAELARHQQLIELRSKQGLTRAERKELRGLENKHGQLLYEELSAYRAQAIHDREVAQALHQQVTQMYKDYAAGKKIDLGLLRQLESNLSSAARNAELSFAEAGAVFKGAPKENVGWFRFRGNENWAAFQTPKAVKLVNRVPFENAHPEWVSFRSKLAPEMDALLARNPEASIAELGQLKMAVMEEHLAGMTAQQRTAFLKTVGYEDLAVHSQYLTNTAKGQMLDSVAASYYEGTLSHTKNALTGKIKTIETQLANAKDKTQIASLLKELQQAEYSRVNLLAAETEFHALGAQVRGTGFMSRAWSRINNFGRFRYNRYQHSMKLQEAIKGYGVEPGKSVNSWAYETSILGAPKRVAGGLIRGTWGAFSGATYRTSQLVMGATDMTFGVARTCITYPLTFGYGRSPRQIFNTGRQHLSNAFTPAPSSRVRASFDRANQNAYAFPVNPGAINNPPGGGNIVIGDVAQMGILNKTMTSGVTVNGLNPFLAGTAEEGEVQAQIGGGHPS